MIYYVTMVMYLFIVHEIKKIEMKWKNKIPEMVKTKSLLAKKLVLGMLYKI